MKKLIQKLKKPHNKKNKSIKNERKSPSKSIEINENKIKVNIKYWNNWRNKTKKGKFKIELNDKDLNIITIYTFQSANKTTYYYQYNKRLDCKGKGKFDLEKQKFYIINKYDIKIAHNEINRNNIIDLIENNQYEQIYFSLKKA